MTPFLWEGYRLGGRYELLERLGEGGMSTVYKAFDHNLRRTVAVKVIHPHLVDDEDFVRRFQSEARAVARLRHPNIVQVFDFATEGELHYMVLEYIPGETLQQRLEHYREQGRGMPWRQAVRIVWAIADALAYAHRQGMIHRDIKPANILLRPSGEPVLTDFGLARLVDATTRTRTGVVLGTMAYMAPEQLRGQPIDHRADIYALGAVLFEALTGRRPYDGDNIAEILGQHLRADIPDPRTWVPDLPPALSHLVQRALAKAPEQRFAQTDEFRDALQDLLADTSEERPAPDTHRQAAEPMPVPSTATAAPAKAAATPPSARQPRPPDHASPATVSGDVPAPTAEARRALNAAGYLAGFWLLALGGGLVQMLAPPSWRRPLWIGAAFLSALNFLALGVRVAPAWWRISRQYRLTLVRVPEAANPLHWNPLGRFQVPRLAYPYDVALMGFPVALAVGGSTSIGLAAALGVAPGVLALLWLLFALPGLAFHLRFLALSFLQPGLLDRLHFGHFWLALALGAIAVPGMGLAYRVPRLLREGVLVVALGSFSVGGMLGALTLIFLLRRALNTGLPRPALAPLMFVLAPLIGVYTTFALLLVQYSAREGLPLPPLVTRLMILTAWGITGISEALAALVYAGYRRVGVPFGPLQWSLLDAFLGPGLLALLTWRVYGNTPLIALLAAGSLFLALDLAASLLWQTWQRRA